MFLNFFEFLYINCNLDSEELFWTGVNILTLIQQKLDSGFWLLSNAFSAPDELYIMIRSNMWYIGAQSAAKNIIFEEDDFSDAEDIISQFTQTEGLSTIQNTIGKSLKHPYLFSWMVPLLKTLSEFENYFSSMVKTITLCLLQLVGEVF